MTILISLLLILSTFVVMPQSFEIFRYPKEMVSIPIMLAMVWYSTSRYPLYCKNKYLMILPIIGFIGLLFNNVKMPMLFQGNDIAIIDGNDIGIPIQMMANKEFFYYILGVFTIWSIASANIDIKKIVQTIKWVLIVLLGYAIMQALRLDQFFHGMGNNPHWQHLIAGTLGNPSLLGLYLAILAPVCLYLKQYWLWIITGVVIGCTMSTTGIIGYVLVGLIWQMRKRFWIGVISVILCSLIAVMFIESKGIGKIVDKERLLINKLVFDDIKQRAITGYGAGTFEYRFGNHPTMRMFGGERLKEAHNEFLQIWDTVGIVGLISFILSILWFIKYIVQRFQDETVFYVSCCLLVVGISLFTWFPLRVAPLSTFTIVLLGMLMNESNYVS